MRSVSPRTTARRARLGAALAGLLAVAALTPVAAPAAGAADDAADVTGAPGDPSRVARSAVSTDFTLASFNVLGSSHTRHSARYATGVERVRGVVRLLDRHAVDVVGFQEMQADQLQAFLDRTGGRFDVYPGFQRIGDRRVDTDNSLAWDTTSWQAVETTTVDIPYFDGRPRAMPVVRLRNLQTGMTAWFGNFHNPATNRKHPGQDGWRAQAIADEVALARRLHKTGVPVFFTGDMNEREEVFCPMTGEAPMRAARGGTNRDGVCNARNPWYVDWIFGTKRLRFSDYVEDTSALVKRTTDHPVIVAAAHVDPLKFPDAIQPVPDPAPLPAP